MVRWTADDSADRKQEIDYAELRLAGWARWCRSGNGSRLDFSSVSAIVNAMMPTEEELQAGAKHLATECSDDEAMEVEVIVLRWKHAGDRWWKIVWKEYFTGGPHEKKARELGINRDMYRDELKALQLSVFRELRSKHPDRDLPLASARRNLSNSGRLGSVPAKVEKSKARS